MNVSKDKLKEWQKKWDRAGSNPMNERIFNEMKDELIYWHSMYESCLKESEDVGEYQRKKIDYLKSIVSQCRCEECGNELGENWEDNDGIFCQDCDQLESED